MFYARLSVTSMSFSNVRHRLHGNLRLKSWQWGKFWLDVRPTTSNHFIFSCNNNKIRCMVLPQSSGGNVVAIKLRQATEPKLAG
jgi:hypothetical protein